MSEPHVVVLGAGPAGAGAAWQLRNRARARVTLVEQQRVVGGNAGSFELDGVRVDFGSHRLHPACDAEVLRDIRTLLGDDLLDRPRHGRIRLRGRWIHFPLKPLDLLLRLDPGFGASTLGDMVRKATARTPVHAGAESFASVLRANLGPTICNEFYFPYARKIWGREPDALSAIQARRRVSAGSFGKLVRKVASSVPGLKPAGAGRFFYPRHGFGQITEAYADAARALGADVRLGTRVTGLVPPSGDRAPWRVRVERDGASHDIDADYVWSTLPIPIIARAYQGEVPEAVRAAAAAIHYRAMVLVYLVLDIDRFTEFDAHYFPERSVRITRLSEQKNYAARSEPVGRTVLCAELPCDPDDETWALPDEALGNLVVQDLQRSGIPVPVQPARVVTRRLRQAYPIYLSGYEKPFGALDTWVESLPRLLSYGRQGLFAHDNTHHALYMAYAAVDCLRDGEFDAASWRRYRDVFATHVVED
ncbi:MAG TPA: FAD-dependent oxidoreductase [Gemmatimonadaceae bacterium]|nr:FAD-dependent oxidoreductase [Gemmatimonadaceae bacterium]